MFPQRTSAYLNNYVTGLFSVKRVEAPDDRSGIDASRNLESGGDLGETTRISNLAPAMWMALGPLGFA